MVQYAVVEIKGRQYKVDPKKEILVDFLGEDLSTFECDKVLLLSENGDLKVGTPYLSEKLSFDVLEKVVKNKIRVATYHAKANTRKVKGSVSKKTKLKLHQTDKK